MTSPPALVLLDSGPLGLVTHPRATPDAQECKAWLQRILAAGHRVLVPAICYYEVRRELRRSELRAGTPSRGLLNLDKFAADAGIVSITLETLLLATELWADARNRNAQGAPDVALDADMILCAQARLLRPADWEAEGATVVIATGNVKHLADFTPAAHWRDME